MEQNKELYFKVMVMYSEVLEKAIIQHNKHNNTDFEIVEIIDDEVVFCVIKVSRYKPEDLFVLGHRLSVIEYTMKEKCEIDW